MIKVFTPNASRTLDARCIAGGIDEDRLIEQAAGNAAIVIEGIIREHFPDGTSCDILIVCGSGNNGADGLIIAKHLSRCHSIRVLIPPADQSVSAGFRYAMSQVSDLEGIIRGYDIPDYPYRAPDVIIDAIVGSGSHLPLRHDVGAVVAILNHMPSLKIAVDLPTGLDPLQGTIDVNVMHCDHTVAMEGIKPGHLRGSGPAVSGRLHIASIGAPVELSDECSDGAVMEPSDVALLLPMRKRMSSKFDYGHVTVIGGTLGMRGAPSMTAHAALGIGAGLVDLACPAVHPLTPREIMTTTLPHNEDGTIASESVDTLTIRIQRSNVIAIGPGLGANARTTSLLADLINDLPADRTVVLDADGLRCLDSIRNHQCRLIITPHLGELARHLGRSRHDIAPGYVEHAQQLSVEFNCITHIKHVPSATVDAAHTTYLQCGNPAMATAGSGDILTGLIAGLCAQGMSAYDATRCAAWLHATAADQLVASSGRASILASELIHAAALERARLMDVDS